MQPGGPGVFGPPKIMQTVRVLQEAVESGVNHIDTSDFFAGPHVTNQAQSLGTASPYSADLCIVTKVSARRDDKGNWLPAMSLAEPTSRRWRTPAQSGPRRA